MEGLAGLDENAVSPLCGIRTRSLAGNRAAPADNRAVPAKRCACGPCRGLYPRLFSRIGEHKHGHGINLRTFQTELLLLVRRFQEGNPVTTSDMRKTTSPTRIRTGREQSSTQETRLGSVGVTVSVVFISSSKIHITVQSLRYPSSGMEFPLDVWGDPQLIQAISPTLKKTRDQVQAISLPLADIRVLTPNSHLATPKH